MYDVCTITITFKGKIELLRVPGCWVVRNEAVGHHYEGEEAARDVLYGEVDSQPDPPVHLVQVDASKEVPYSTQGLPCHTEGQERFPSKPVTPTPNVEGEQDGHRVLCDGDDVVETDHLKARNAYK